MHSRRVRGCIAAALLVLCGRAAFAEDEALYRVFLTDGTALLSYGEPALVGDRVVFPMPTAAIPNPPLHLMDLSAARVDWPRTTRYTEAARAARYVETQAELDYAALSNRMTEALNQITQIDDAARRLAIAESARKMLAAWPATHYNYRLNEVRQMLALLDEAIADLRAAAGAERFNLSLTAFVEPPAVTERLAPPPTAQETIERVLAAAQLAETAGERTALFEAALDGLDRAEAVLPLAWLVETRAVTRAQLDAERRIDGAYQSLTARIMALAERHARAADVTSLARLVDTVHANDRALGGKRPEAVNLLVTAVQTRLDAARRLRLARDRWAMREAAYRQYRLAIKAPLDLFATLEPSLERIRLLAGSSASSLTTIQKAVVQILRQAQNIVPPDEFRASHALLVSAVQLAANAAQIRREATLAGDIARAWDASSAAAGALMLGARARTDMQDLLRPPQLR
jgi:hypothetical protein